MPNAYLALASPIDELGAAGWLLSKVPYVSRIGTFTSKLVNQAWEAISGWRKVNGVIGTFSRVNAASVNKAFTSKGWDAPYDEAYDVLEGITKNDEEFVRVFKNGVNSPQGAWLAKSGELKGLSPEQIKDKFALDYIPDSIVKVNVPAGTKIRIGRAAGRESVQAIGGGNQVELLERIPSENFTNIQKLK